MQYWFGTMEEDTMEYRKLDKLGIETSLLGFGCMRFPTIEGEIDEEEAEKMIDRAIKGGVNYIDTAYPYHNGKSEPFVGRVLQKYPRDSYYLATKLPCWGINALEDAKRLLQEQLDRLQTDHIDFYLMHAMNRDLFRKMAGLGVVDYLEQMKQEGRIRFLGFSFHDGYDAFEEIITYRDWDFCQIQYNYMDTDEQAGDRGYALTEKLGIPVIIMEPIKGGSLACFAEDITAIFGQMDPDASIASFALRWVGSLPNVKVILSGMSSMEQVEDNLATFTDFKPLSAKEKATIEEIAALIRSRVKNGCTGCRYCMPCPAGVDIPGNFSAWNTYHMYQNYNVVRWNWETQLGESKQAKNCIKCGKCEQACPQKLSIRADLEKVQTDLDKKEFLL